MRQFNTRFDPPNVTKESIHMCEHWRSSGGAIGHMIFACLTQPFFLGTLLVLSFLGTSLTAHAELYTYVDEDGVTMITSEYRKGAQVIDGIEEQAPGPRRRARIKTRKHKKNRKNKKGSVSKKRRNTRAGQGLRALPKRARVFDKFVEDAALYYDLPQALIWGVMYVESSFNPRAVSNKGAQGLMQLMPLTAQDMGVTDAFDPEQNIYGGARLLRILANRFNGDLVLTLSAYHAGGGAVSSRGGIPYEKTAQYVRSTLNAYYRYMDNPPTQK